MKILVTGAGGQLGKEFLFALNSKGSFTVIGLRREDLDISNLSQVLRVMREIKPDVVINCSAYNEVDRAESDGFEDAIRVNTFGARNLALAVGETGALLIHYSSDYVFGGEKRLPYREDDHPSPVNRYGLSKLLGEKEIYTLLDESSFLIFRVSWVYGRGHRNFLYKLRSWANAQEMVRVACDEFSVPTSTSFIVEFTLKAIDSGLRGLYHLVPSDFTSRYEWAKEYFKLAGIRKTLIPAYQSDFELPAKRPGFSAMSNEKLAKTLNSDIPDWKEVFRKYMNHVE